MKLRPQRRLEPVSQKGKRKYRSIKHNSKIKTKKTAITINEASSQMQAWMQGEADWEVVIPVVKTLCRPQVGPGTSLYRSVPNNKNQHMVQDAWTLHSKTSIFFILPTDISNEKDIQGITISPINSSNVASKKICATAACAPHVFLSE